MTADPHASGRVLAAGVPLGKAKKALILLHGRGACAEDILSLGEAFALTDWTMLAPQAAGNTWYPYSFLAPREQNEPYLASALRLVQTTVDQALAAGIAMDQIAITGFSQGACLATEFVGRHPMKYAALIAFTGGLIGPPDVPITLTGNLEQTPILLSSGDPDPHVPWQRVEQSGELLQQIGGRVTLRRYPGRPHTVFEEELVQARQMLNGLAVGGSA